MFAWAAVMLVAAGLAAAAGCASFRLPEPNRFRPASERQERKSKALDAFEKRRNQAQFTAALAHWHQGDAAACETMLLQLLERDPTHREARQTLADLYAATGRTDEARKHLRVLLSQYPQDARACHAMGLLLDSIGQSGEAQQYFDRALQLDPGNELYALCQRACASSQSAAARPEPRNPDGRPEPVARENDATPTAQAPAQKPAAPTEVWGSSARR